MDIFLSAFRSLRAHAAFSSLIVLLLALGIGANTTIFGVVHAVLLKPLPYPEPGDLVLVRKPPRDGAPMIGGGDVMPDTEFLAWTEAAPKSFRALAAYRNNAVTLQRGDGAVRAPAAAVTGEFFRLLGVTAWRGRLFSADDLKTGATPATVLSYSAWQAQFKGADDAIGQVVKLDEVAHIVIGVLPPAFEFTDPVQFWRPLPLNPAAPGQLRIQMLRVFGRLLPGTSPAVATRELDTISENFWNALTASFGPPPGPGPAPAGPGGGPGPVRRIIGGPPGGPGPMPRLPFADAKAQLVPLHEQLARQSRTTLWLLLGAVGFVLLIACANIANLQLARAAARRRDSAVRAALGASPAQLALELLAENLLLALLGGLLGVLLAWWGIRILPWWLADYLPRVNPLTLNGPVLGFAVLLTTTAGLAFGLMPAWQGSRIDLLEALKEGGHQSSPARHRWRQALIALEVALGLVLVINTGLLMKSIRQLYAHELGYRTSDVLTANLALPRRYGSAAQQRDFSTRWLDALGVLPGVKIAALTDIPPLSPYQQMVVTSARGSATAVNASNAAPPPAMAIGTVTPEYFRATGIALREGRYFNASDGADAPAVVIVNEEFVRQFYPQGLTLGTPLDLPGENHGGPPPTGMIVGVVANIRPRGFESSAQPFAYFPLVQQPRARLSAVLQCDGDPAAVARAVSVATHKLDADLALDNPSTLEEQISRQTAPRRITLILTGTFAGVALLLAGLGIFGVMNYTVTQRTAEIGVRMALGADTGTILRWVLRYGGGAIMAGLIAGLALTFATGKLLQSALAGVAGLDPLIALGATLILSCCGLVACLIPALRATRVNPVDALRSE